MWILCQAEDSHEISSLIFFEIQWKGIYRCRLLQLWLALWGLSNSGYSLIQMKCQGGNKWALPITVKFDQSTRRFSRIRFACLFKLAKLIVFLFYLLSPYLLCIRGSRNVIENMYIIMMNGWLAILRPFSQYFSHIRTPDSASGRDRTRTARPVGLRLNPLSYRVSVHDKTILEVCAHWSTVCGIGCLRKSGGQKIDLISLLLNKFSWNFAYLFLLPIRTQAKEFRIFQLFNKKLLY